MTDEPSPLDALPEEIEWEEHSPSTYLFEAFTALLELLDPYGPKGTVGATGHRVRWARIATLFAAFAAEGYINRALRERLSRTDFDSVERLSTPDKYAIASVVAFGERLFDRGAEPLQSIQVLFDLRNSLAHPKPRKVTISRNELFADPHADIFRPSEAVRFVLAVAEAAQIVSDKTGTADEVPSAVLAMSRPLVAKAAQADALPRPTLADYQAVYEQTLRREIEPRQDT